MKKITRIALTLIVCLSTISCKKEVKKEIEKPETKIGFSIDNSTTKIEWIAYKTTDKIAVKGEFTKIDITSKSKVSENVTELIDGTAFSIPVSSLFSNNEVRDSKLQEFFFNIMDTTELLTGKINIDSEQNGTLTITMNSVTNTVPITYTISAKEFTLSGTMDLTKWNAQNAIESLNKACLHLHKAADGISKTWNDVAISATISFK